MTSKIRLLTRVYDLSVEGESVEEVEELLNILEAAGLIGVNNKPQTPLSPAGELSAQSMSASPMEQFNTIGPPSLESFSAAEGTGPKEATPLTNVSRAVSLVTKRDADIYMLSPKFPNGPEGERSADAALILLAAYDQVKETPVTGSKLLKSLRYTGYKLDRVDKILEPLVNPTAGGVSILTDGIRRGRRYHLSEAGRAKAQQLAEELCAIKGCSVEKGDQQ